MSSWEQSRKAMSSTVVGAAKKQRYRAYNSALWSNYGYRTTTKAIWAVARQTTPTTDKPPLLDFCYFTCTGWAKKTVLFSDLITLWRIVPERRAVCQNFGNFIQKKRYKTRISVSLNIICQISSNRHNSWNYDIYDQNTWLLLNLH